MGQKPTAGFIGLGDQGAPIARRIVEAGYPLTIWARREASTALLSDTAAKVAATPAALAADCDLIGICVVTDKDVEQVTLESGLLDAIRPGSGLAIHFTLLPGTVHGRAKAARTTGVHFLEP